MSLFDSIKTPVFNDFMPIQQKKLLAFHIYAFILIVAMQWLHFAWYFKQPISLALVWSIVDWAVWFLLFSLFWRIRENKSKARMILIALTFIVSAGPVQIIISSGIYQLLFEAEKTLAESFFHLMNKRWFQNTLIASCVVVVYQMIEYKLRISSAVHTHNDSQSSELNVFDGRTHHKIKSCDVYAACTTKNYVSLYTKEEEVVIRATLKEVKEQLDDFVFVQVSRSALVNTQAMSRLTKYSNSSFHIILVNEMSIKVSRTYLNDVKACFT